MEDIDIEQFINKMEDYGELYGWDDDDIIHYSLCRLEGNAKIWKDSLPRSYDFRDWSEWKILLFEHFPVLRSIVAMQ